jgi:4-hydroxy-3-polyprenylbenzoate decarboxylase
MAYSSFSDFLAALERAGEVKRIPFPVATELEITEMAEREMKSPGGGKALLFEKPTVNGVVSPFPLAINTWARTAAWRWHSASSTWTSSCGRWS